MTTVSIYTAGDPYGTRFKKGDEIRDLQGAPIRQNDMVYAVDFAVFKEYRAGDMGKVLNFNGQAGMPIVYFYTTGVKIQCYARKLIEQDVRLSSCQEQAMLFVSSRCHEDMEQHESSLKKKLAEMDYNFDAVDRWMRFEVPLIIHTKLTGKSMDCYLNDTHYRNLFEVGRGRGCTDLSLRGSWEKHHFGGAFEEAAASERPKYGCLNLSNDLKGVESAAMQYGTSFFVLKGHVRWRCTFTLKDSCVTTAGNAPGTAYQHPKFLDALPRHELELVAAHRGGSLRSYKEVQIHGPVRFSEDIAMIVASDEIPVADRRKVVRFAEKNNIQLMWTTAYKNGPDCL